MKKFITLLLSFCVIGLITAHEYILYAAKYRVAKGDNLEVHLFVADGFNVQLEKPFQKTPTVSFELMTSAGRTDLAGTTDGALPIVNRKVDFEGGGLIQLTRSYARITLATNKFFEYLTEDHIEGIAAKVDRSKNEQKERYTRYIKTLVQSGTDCTDTIYKTITGQRFEIVLLDNPYKLNTGKSLRAKILFDGKPLVNRVIKARNRTGSEAASVQTARTDAKGICVFKITRKGDWVIHATQMILCPDQSDSDWESFWTSYSFGIS